MSCITIATQWGFQPRYTGTAGKDAAGQEDTVLDYGLRFSDPAKYSRALRRAHELVISGVPRPEIPTNLADSWRRSMALGISPDQHSPRHLHDVSDVLELRREHRLQQVMPALHDLLADDSSSGRHLLVLTDASGEILWRVGSPDVLRRADRLEFSEGADWSEAGIGTNAISEALLTGQPVQLFSAEHLVRTHHEWACTAAPITDPATGRLLGVLDVSGPLDTLSADTLRMVRCAVRVAETLLGTHDGGASLGALPSIRAPRASVRRPSVGVESLELLGDKPAALFADGSRVPLTLRRAEILALLDSRAQGWSAEELTYELHGDAGTPQAIRTEMFRVRSMLGDAVESSPYRLAADLTRRSDSGRVLRLLREGLVEEALEAYTAPLLSRSGAMTVQLLRDQLDLAVGSAVRASGDAEMLIRWLSTDMGRADFEAVEALGRLSGRGDARYLSFRAGTSDTGRNLLG
ncbi:GAF domain-containing protein [Pseudarthrobacter sp. H3Y2-7]|uniref:GAF domain-containing protein n=1 Tax=Pseudarthrobacter naphthalenicus TaxID=3031328 RepID=UPI0023AFDD8C|nr:GAF domain-containing protein [Pseudarthrobacter sp. H3Y2-7]MDE8670762.1 GAF domain-containing protein [Pseudarthrobacter sp. H3Y2-7]